MTADTPDACEASHRDGRRSPSDRRRLVMIGLLAAALIGQGAYSFGVHPEPYPTIRLPSFSGAPDDRGAVHTTTLEITIAYAAGPDVVAHADELMAELPSGSRRSAVDHVFIPANNQHDPRPADDPDVTKWLKERVQSLGGGRPPTSVTFCWREVDIDVRTPEATNRQACELAMVEL